MSETQYADCQLGREEFWAKILMSDILGGFQIWGGIEPNAIRRLQAMQRRILGRNFKTKLLSFSVFSCFFRFSVRLCCMDNWIKTDGRKQENAEKVRSLVFKFLPKILLCIACNLRIALGSIPPQYCNTHF